MKSSRTRRGCSRSAIFLPKDSWYYAGARRPTASSTSPSDACSSGAAVAALGTPAYAPTKGQIAMTPPDWRLERSTPSTMYEPAVQVARRFPWRFFFQVVLVAIFGCAGVTFGLVQWLRSDLPAPDKLTAMETPVKTTVFDSRGRVLHEFYRENRSVVPLKNIPRNLVNATLSTEDRNFYKHWGVDLWGVGRAVVTDVMHMRRAQGGSTITQQLA